MFAAFLGLLHHQGAAQGTWVQRANFGGLARYWASGFTIGTKVYIGTGYSGSTNYNDFWEYDPATNVWTQKASYPGGGRLYITGFSIGNKGYFGCGWNSTYRNDFWEYDPALNTWTQKANFPGAGRWGAAGFSIGSKGYIGIGASGGNGTLCQSDFYEYDQATNTWTQKANYPGVAVYGGAGFSIGTKGYIGTGFANNVSYRQFYEYDQATNTWTQKADFGGTARYQVVGFAIGSKGYIGLGSGGSDLWQWDQATNTWTTQGNYPTGNVNVCVGVAVGGKGYVGTGSSATRDFFEFTPCTASTPTISANGPTAICQGGNVVLTTSSASSYAWSNGSTSQSITVSNAGNYNVTVVNAQGCAAAAAMTPVTVISAPNVTATASQPAICVGAMQTLTGGGATTYTWNNGVNNNTPFLVNNGAPTSYTVTGTDANGCTNTATISFTINPQPNVTANASQPEVCQGGTVTLTGSGASTYAWNNSVINGVPFTPSSSQTYTVTGTDANGCINTASIAVPVNPLPTVTAYTTAATVCQGDSVTLTGGGASTYAWDNGVNNAIAFAPASTLLYTVIGTDSNSCTNAATVTVVVNALPNVQANTTASQVCQGTALTLTGSGAANYVWDNGVLDGVAFIPPSTQTYNVTGTDANGCANAATVSVVVNPLPSVQANTTAPQVCQGASVTLSGSGATNYAWNNGVQNGISFIPTSTQLYTVTGTDNNGCTATAFVTVGVNPLPTVLANASSSAVCAGDPVTLTGSGASTYIWNNGVLDGLPFVPNSTQVYTVTGTDANGCQNAGIVTVTVNPLPNVALDLSLIDTLCPWSGPTTLIGASPAGGTFSGTGVTGNAFDPLTTGLGLFGITYTLTDANGCTGSATDFILVEPCTALEPETQGLEATIFPNPFTEATTLQLSQALHSGMLQIFDAQGKQLRQQSMSGNRLSIEQGTLPSGVYYLRISDQTGLSLTRKLVVQ